MDTPHIDNRTNILTIALDLFANRGYESVGVQEIADKAQISKPTLYHYYGSKRGLLDSIISVYGDKLLDVLNQGTTYNHNLVMNLTVITQEMINFAIINESFYRFHIALSSAAPENEGFSAYQPLRKKIQEKLEYLFVSASLDHGNMKGREKAFSETFQGMIKTWAMLVLNKEQELTDHMLYQSVHLFMHGIFS